VVVSIHQFIYRNDKLKRTQLKSANKLYDHYEICTLFPSWFDSIDESIFQLDENYDNSLFVIFISILFYLMICFFFQFGIKFRFSNANMKCTLGKAKLKPIKNA
jgi:cbb3-type cytochrome oxidase subunit 3